MKKQIGFLMILSTAVALSYSCGQKSQKKETQGSILASVNKVAIYEDELKRQATMSAHANTSSSSDPKKIAMDELIDDEVLFQEAVKENYHRKEGIKRQIVRQFLNDKTKAMFNFTDAELQKYFDDHREELARIRASHILIKPEKKGDAASEAKALGTIEAILKKAKGGQDFAELAKSHSQDPGSARRGGDLRFFNRRMMVASFADAAFALKNIGDVSDIVKTDFGYHIIKLTGKQDDIEPLRHIIKASLMKEKRESAQAEIVANLRKNASISVYENNLEKVELKPKAASDQGQPHKMDPEKLKELMEKMKGQAGSSHPTPQ